MPNQRSRSESSPLVVALKELVKTVAIVAVLVLGVRTFVVEAYVVHGASMEPTFHQNERLLVTKLGTEFQHGDIIVFYHPNDPNKRLIKRVVAVAGDVVEISSGSVFVNGVELAEPYLARLGGTYFAAQEVPTGCVFVLGDNREISNDSRILGSIPEDRVIGKAMLRFYPSFDLF